MRPFIKWVGGKTQILDEVLSLFPTEINNYYEPFVGGGSVLLGLLAGIKSGKINLSGKIYAGDVNPILIGVYRNIQMKPDEIIIELNILTDEFSSINFSCVNRKAASLEEANTSQESYYYWIRSRFNSQSDKTSPLASAMFIFLNKTCFRGVYREGPRGFNVPFGNYKRPFIFEEEHIRAVSELIKDVEFNCASFEKFSHPPQTGDFVYMDPPYAPVSEKSFVGYTTDGFDLSKHKLLFKLCSELNENNIKFLMSNADVKLVSDAFSPLAYKIKVIECRRAINSKKPGSKTNEVLISN